MTLEPIGPHLRVRLETRPASPSTLWLPEHDTLGAPAIVTGVGEPGDLQVGQRVIVSRRLLVRVGTEYLVPLEGVLAVLA